MNLDHCDHVQEVRYDAGSGAMTVQFGSQEAYEYAVRTWSTQGGLVLLAHTPGCGDHATGERCYLDVAALDFEPATRRCVARGEPRHPDDLIAKGETEWGWWVPRDGGIYATVAPSGGATTTAGHGAGPGPTSTPGSFSWDAASASRTASASSPSGSVYPGGGSSGGDGNGGSVHPGGSSSGGGGGGGSGGSLYPPYGGNGATNSTGPFSGSNSTGPVSGSNSSDIQDSDFTKPRVVCKAPVDTKYGLPTACESDLFDQDLDDDLGYTAMPVIYSSFLKEITPVPELHGSASEDPMVSARGLVLQRRNWLTSGLKSVGRAFDKHVIKPAVSLYNSAADATSIPGSINKELSWKLPDPANANAEAKTLKDPNAKQVVSPWGDAVLLKAYGSQESEESKKLNGYMNVFCVSCGVSGSAKIAGRAAWSPIGGFTKGEVEINTDAQFVFKLGIDAQMTYQQTFENALLDFGIPGLSYGVVTIGPRITVGTNVALEAKAKGRLLAGAEMGLQNAHVLIDFVHPAQSRKDGWEPYFKPVFEAEGDLMLSAGLGLPIGIKCGLQISKWDKSVGIVAEPSIKGVAQVAASVGLTATGQFAAGFRDTNGCTGISTQLSWRNRLYIDILGLSKSVLHDTQDKPLAQGCIKLPGLPASAAPSATTKTATTIATPVPTGGDAQTGSEGSTPVVSPGSEATSPPTPTGDAEATPTPADNGSEPSGSNNGSDEDTATTDPAPSSDNDQQGSGDSQDAPAEQEQEPEQEQQQQQQEEEQNQEQQQAQQHDQEQDQNQSDSTEQTEADSSESESGQAPEKRDYPFELTERDEIINATTMGSVIDLTNKVVGSGGNNSNGTSSSSASSTLTYTTSAVGNRAYNATSGLEFALLVTPDARTMVVSCGDGNVYAFSAAGDENPNCSEMWAATAGGVDALVADGAYRLLHYYANTMDRLGVSRLRVDDAAALPAHAVVVAFLPYGALADEDADEGTAAETTTTQPAEGLRRRQEKEESTETDASTSSSSTTSNDSSTTTSAADDYSIDDVYFALDPSYSLFYPVVCNYAEAGKGPKVFLARDPEAGPRILASPDVAASITGGRVTDCAVLDLMQGRWATDADYSSASAIDDKAAADLLDFEDGYDQEVAE